MLFNFFFFYGTTIGQPNWIWFNISEYIVRVQFNNSTVFVQVMLPKPQILWCIYVWWHLFLNIKIFLFKHYVGALYSLYLILQHIKTDTHKKKIPHSLAFFSILVYITFLSL